MTREEKSLLLQDLCARLLCGVQGITSDGIVSPLIVKGEADWDILTSLNYRIVKHGWKPYLRPLSSMTEEESLKYVTLTHYNTDDNGKPYRELTLEALDWLNSHHFDYRGLIEKGLALEAPEDIYKTKTE